MPITFEFTDTSDYGDLTDYRDKMCTSHNPLYMWGNIAKYDDDQVDDLLGVPREKSLRHDHKIPLTRSDQLLSYFVEIGVHPAYVLPMKHLGYPEPIVQAIIDVAKSDRFTKETRKEALNALKGIQAMFADFAREHQYPERVESVWKELNPAALKLGGSGGLEMLSGFFDTKASVLSVDPVLVTERKFELYEEYLESVLKNVKAKRDKSEADKKKYNRRINDARLLMFGDDDGEFVSGFQEAEAFLFDCMKQPHISGLSRKKAWECIAETIVDPKGVFRDYLQGGIENAFGRVGEGRFFGWPNIGREYAIAYYGHGEACDALKDAKQEVEKAEAELNHFRQFCDFIAGEPAQMSLYHAKHMVDALDVYALQDDIYDFMPLVLSSDRRVDQS